MPKFRVEFVNKHGVPTHHPGGYEVEATNAADAIYLATRARGTAGYDSDHVLRVEMAEPIVRWTPIHGLGI